MAASERGQDPAVSAAEGVVLRKGRVTAALSVIGKRLG